MPLNVDQISTGSLSVNGTEINKNGGLPYKVYTALLTQSGTDAPVATVLENTIGNIIWTRVNAGQYECQLIDAFVEDKTGILTTSTADGYTEAYWNNVNTCQIITFNTSGVYTDGYLYKQLVEIRVYN
jgi:hypothetical protein